jgi:hypothetical protein
MFALVSAMASLVSSRFRRRASLDWRCSPSDVSWPFSVGSFLVGSGWGEATADYFDVQVAAADAQSAVAIQLE